MSKTKLLLILMLGGTVTFFLGLGLYASLDRLSAFEIGVTMFVVIVTLFGIFVARGKLKDEKKGLPAEDEMSKVVRDRAGATSFLISFYVWVFVILFFSNSSLDFEVIIGGGLFAMTLVFMGCWFYFSKVGVHDENQN